MNQEIIEEKNLYTFKFYNIRERYENNNFQYSLFSNSNNKLKNTLDNIFINNSSSKEYKKGKVAIFDIIEKNEEYILGKYSVVPSDKCLNASNRNLKDLSEKKIKDIATNYYTFFYLDILKKELVIIEDSSTPGFLENLRKLVYPHGLLIDMQVDQDWKKIVQNTFKEINKIQIKVLKDEENPDHYSSIKNVGLVSEYLQYEKSTFKVKPISIKTIIDDIAKTNLNEFETFKIEGKTINNTKQHFELIKDTIQKKKNKYYPPSAIYMPNSNKDLVDIFKSLLD